MVDFSLYCDILCT